jgi:hypothetical protein
MSDLFGTTGETIDTFKQLYELVYPERQNTQQRSKTSCLINWKNQLLMTLIWLRSYPTCQYLALLRHNKALCCLRCCVVLFPGILNGVIRAHKASNFGSSLFLFRRSFVEEGVTIYIIIPLS